MLLQIAWRNIWRNKIRSLVVISSIAIGLWAGIFILAFAWGLYRNNIDETVRRQLSHIQIHHPSFISEQESKYVLPHADTARSLILKEPSVLSVSNRLLTTGMISSPTNTAGVTIFGISPDLEKQQTKLDENLLHGTYFTSGKDNTIYIGEKLAEKLKVKLRSKVVLTFTDIGANIVSGAFRVEGIYRSKNTSLDKVYVYVSRQELSALLGLNASDSNEMAVLLEDDKDLEYIKQRIQQLMPTETVEDWKDLSPDLELVIESFHIYTYIITGIILLALTFGIVNTMLMSVLERIRELGMLMAIGMNKKRIFSMIMLETLLLTFIGCPLGLFLGWISVLILGKQGINLAVFSEGLASYGFNAMIYPALETNKYWIVALMSLATALLSAIYPAWRALQLNPAESIRKI